MLEEDDTTNMASYCLAHLVGGKQDHVQSEGGECIGGVKTYNKVVVILVY